MKLPPLTRQPILEVDATPDKGYPLRILQAYREGCNCMWATSTGEEEVTDPLLKLMNDHNRQRAAILDKAIESLLKVRRQEFFENKMGD